MSVLAPYFLLAAAFVAAGVVALHFLARSQPPRTLFPPSRFVPESRERAPSRSVTPNDLLLLALRVLAVMLLGLAFARPTLTAARRALVRIVLLDRSRAVASPAAASDSARRWVRDGDVLVVFDSVANVAGQSALDSVPRSVATGVRGSLSGAIVRAVREGTRLRDLADSIEIVVVSPFVAEEWDGATAAVRATWPGGMRLVHVSVARDGAAGQGISLRGPADDPLRATLALMGVGADGARTAERARIVRDARLTASDSAWARGGGVLVHWAAADRADPRDTVGAVVANGVVLIAPFVRGAGAVAGAPVARWVDGATAATEQPLDAGCVRTVAVPLDRPGDLVLRPALRRFVRALAAPCGGARDFTAVDALHLAALAGTSRPAAAAALVPAQGAGRSLVPWLIGLAVLALGAEQLLRRARSIA